MLKGQLDLDTELIGGTITFVTLATVIVGILMMPMFFAEYREGSTYTETKAIKYANLVRYGFSSSFSGPDNVMMLSSMIDATGSSLDLIGLGENYVKVTELITGREWEFPGRDGKFAHNLFTHSHAEFIFQSSEDLVMESQMAYIVHMYKIERNTIIDVYDEFDCIEGDDTVDDDGFRKIRCVDIVSLPLFSYTGEDVIDDTVSMDDARPFIFQIDFFGLLPILDVIELLSETISAEDSNEPVLRMFVARQDMLAGDIIPSETMLSKDCLEGRDKVCIRKFGEYTLPLEIRVEMRGEAPLVSGGENE